MSESSRPRAYLISDLVRPTARQLELALSCSFDLVIVPPVFVEESVLLTPEIVDGAGFQARHFRPPLVGEVGCALAHLNVYRAMKSSPLAWALVVEDDVEISNTEAFGERIQALTRRLPLDQPVIVNLNARAASPRRFSRTSAIAGLWKPSVVTYTTSCYLLNQLAAQKLFDRQVPLTTQADWPLAAHEVLFLQESLPLAAPSDVSMSLVDPAGERAKFPFNMRIQMWTGIWYLRNRNHFQGFHDYWHSVLRRRIYRHIY